MKEKKDHNYLRYFNTGWREVVVVVVVVFVVSEWRRMVECGHNGADANDGCSGNYFSVDNGVDTGGDCCWEAAFEFSQKAIFSLS